MSRGAMLRMRLLRALAYLWAGPVTLLGLVLVAVAAIAGVRCRGRTGVLEATGAGVHGMLRLLRPFGHIGAITFGHVVLAGSAEDLARTRRHERVHVAQYERWGLAFLPAYLVASAWAWLAGGDPYRDNVFEKAAFAEESRAP